MANFGSLYEITILSTDGHNHVVRADDRNMDKRARARTVLTRSSVTVAEGRQKLVDECHRNVWSPATEYGPGQTARDDNNNRLFLLAESHIEVRGLLDKVFGMKTNGVIMIQRHWPSRKTMHIG